MALPPEGIVLLCVGRPVAWGVDKSMNNYSSYSLDQSRLWIPVSFLCNFSQQVPKAGPDCTCLQSHVCKVVVPKLNRT